MSATGAPRARWRPSLGVAAAALWLACAGDRPHPAREAPALLVSSQEMPGDFVLQQRLAVRWDGREGHVDAAVQSACGELTIVLLTPFGTPGTVIRQRGWQVEVSGRHAGEIPIAPERILLDVQRTYLEQPLKSIPGDGSHAWDLRGQRIEETWAGGRLVERVFHPRRAGDDRVRIRYAAGATAQGPPASVSIDSDRFGYHLDVTTLSRTPVHCADGMLPRPAAASFPVHTTE